MSVLVLLIVLFAIGVWLYNRLAALQVRADGAWADVDVQLKRRYDLVPNLVETVKAYAGHERATLESVIAARNRAIGAQGPAAKGQAEGELALALRSLLALAEAYPELRAAEPFGRLQATLAEIEESLQAARRYYNAVVRDLNTRIATFPSNVVARAFHFKPRDFFEIPEPERAVPQVRF